MRIPLYKLFLIVAFYAFNFGIFSYSDKVAGTIFATIAGTAGSLAIILIETDRHFQSAAIATFGSIVGLFVAVILIPARTARHYTYDHFFFDYFILGIGAFMGGFIFTWASRTNKKVTERDNEQG